MAEKFIDMYTNEGNLLSGTPWNCYPRPQMRRNSFFNLNGMWDFALSNGDGFPSVYTDRILVPFPPQSLLSGIHRHCPEESSLYYRKIFSLPQDFCKGRVLLHMGAADQLAQVYLNGRYVGSHVGGYEHFSFDITEFLLSENTLIIRVSDKMSSNVLPYGKQRENRGGMWYTPVSGIWQTVWLESVPDKYIKDISIETGEDFAVITILGDVPDGTVTVAAPEGALAVPLTGGCAHIKLAYPHLWSPEDPYLYEFSVIAGEDRVSSYFALRTLTTEYINGIPRLCLNHKPYFFHGVLDQGYWSDGLFTPAAPSLYEKDILSMKDLGFNTLRKHIKIEPEIFYYECDRLGMIVFQDMVNNGDVNFLRDTALPTIGFKKRKDAGMHKDTKTRDAFRDSMEKTVLQLKNHPCICYWTIFNEGWGQFESTKMYRFLKKLDASRFIATVSGWFKGGESDVTAEHVYFKPFRMKKAENPLVLSEFGGYAFSTEGHVFNPNNDYGYRKYNDREKYVKGLVALYENEIIPAVKKGLCGSVYTQLSDVEDEVNGLMSYDRKVQKVMPCEFSHIAERLREEIENLEIYGSEEE